jgi:hypothetical protein
LRRWRHDHAPEAAGSAEQVRRRRQGRPQLVDRIRDRRDVDTFGYELELARLRNELKKAER